MKKEGLEGGGRGARARRKAAAQDTAKFDNTNAQSSGRGKRNGNMRRVLVLKKKKPKKITVGGRPCP